MPLLRSLAALIALSLTPALAQEAAPSPETVAEALAGNHYTGAFIRGTSTLRVEYRFERAEDGGLEAYRFFPDWIVYPEFGPLAVEIGEDGRLTLPDARYGDAVLSYDPEYRQLTGQTGAETPAVYLHLARDVRPPARPITEEAVRFGEDGALSGLLIRPIGEGPFPAVILYGGRGCYQAMRQESIGRKLAEYGVAALAYDKRGAGESAGDCDTNTFERLAEDGLDAYDFAAGQAGIDAARIGLWGSSAGAWTAQGVSERLLDRGESPAFIVTWVGPATSILQQQIDAGEAIADELGLDASQRALVSEALEINADASMDDQTAYDRLMAIRSQAKSEGWLDDMFAPSDFPESADALDALWLRRFRFDPAPVLSRLEGVPYLSVLGEADPVVPYEINAAALREGLPEGSDVRVVGLPGVTHSQERGDIWRELPDGTAYFKFDRVEAEFLDETVRFLREQGFAQR